MMASCCGLIDPTRKEGAKRSSGSDSFYGDRLAFVDSPQNETKMLMQDGIAGVGAACTSTHGTTRSSQLGIPT